jgi:HEPN domain-containing protein
MRRYEDWLNQAKIDIKAAEQSMKSEFFEWSCFQAHQSAEKALKSLLRFINLESWGHGLVHFLKAWKEETKGQKRYSFDKEQYDDLLKKCQALDSHYIQARGPNGFSSGFPAEY